MEENREPARKPRKPLKRTALKSPTLEAVREWERKPRKRIAQRGRRAKREARDWELGKLLVRERSGGFCEIPKDLRGLLCANLLPHSADHVHHVLPRGRGGKHRPSNLLHVCARGHDWIHGDPEWSERFGLLRSSGEIV